MIENAGAVFVERLLQQLLHVGLGDLTGLGEERLDVGMADHLAHGALGRGFHRALGVFHVEEVFRGVVDHPEDREIDVDDVLVAGQHQAFLGDVAARCRAPIIDGLTDRDAIHARNLGRVDGLDRIGQTEVEAGLGVAIEAAETKHHARARPAARGR